MLCLIQYKLISIVDLYQGRCYVVYPLKYVLQIGLKIESVRPFDHCSTGSISSIVVEPIEPDNE